MADISRLAQPLTLPCGVTLPNRIVKAALTEGLSDGTNAANDRFVTLYRTWGGRGRDADHGNVLLDRFHLERGGNLAVEGQQSNASLDKLAEMASAARAHSARIVVQLNHAGRQTQRQPSTNGRTRRPTSLSRWATADLGNLFPQR
ncbi:MAG: hypothetical protein H6874_14095 [Hyphomicrobiaceae bacterium]|nr:hypothetical protein [Hyphomicrobiaceae bacterium]